MASFTVAASDRAVHNKTLTASTVDTVTFDGETAKIEVYSSGTAAIFVTVNGTTPTVNGANCFFIPAAQSAREIDTRGDFGGEVATVVKLISSGTPTYAVTRLAG